MHFLPSFYIYYLYGVHSTLELSIQQGPLVQKNEQS